MPTITESPLSRLSDEQIEELGKVFDAIHDDVYDDLGERDRRYITSMIAMHRRLAVLGRVLLLASRYRPAWVAGTGSLSAAGPVAPLATASTWNTRVTSLGAAICCTAPVADAGKSAGVTGSAGVAVTR